MFDKEKVNEAIDLMLDHNQLIFDHGELKLSAFMMNKYVRKTMSEEYEQRFMSKIADFYSRFLAL